MNFSSANKIRNLKPEPTISCNFCAARRFAKIQGRTAWKFPDFGRSYFLSKDWPPQNSLSTFKDNPDFNSETPCIKLRGPQFPN